MRVLEFEKKITHTGKLLTINTEIFHWDLNTNSGLHVINYCTLKLKILSIVLYNADLPKIQIFISFVVCVLLVEFCINCIFLCFRWCDQQLRWLQ